MFEHLTQATNDDYTAVPRTPHMSRLGGQMFGKGKRKRQELPRRVVGPSAGVNPYQPFKLVDYMLSHPVYHNWHVSYDTGNAQVFVAGPYGTGGDNFRLVDLPHETWVQLTDKNGRRIPLELYVDYSGIVGRWLP